MAPRVLALLRVALARANRVCNARATPGTRSMPALPPPSNVKLLWKEFVRAVRSLVSEPSPDRFDLAFQDARDSAFATVESDAMADEIERAYQKSVAAEKNEPSPGADAAIVVLKEIEALPIAVAIHEVQTRTGNALPGALERLRKSARTVLGSVGDLFSLSAFGKGALTVLKEVLDLAGPGGASDASSH